MRETQLVMDIYNMTSPGFEPTFLARVSDTLAPQPLGLHERYGKTGVFMST